MFFDPIYTIYILPGLILSIIAEIWIKSAYSKNSDISSGYDKTSLDIAKEIILKESLPISINISGPALSDSFDPSRDIINMSTRAVQSNSVADIAVTLHEIGHAKQKYDRSPLFILRTGIVPIVNIGSRLGYILIIIGLLLNVLQLAQIGIILFASTTVFALITVPIEIDASKKAIQLINKYNLIQPARVNGAKQVLTAAAMTYIASLLTSFLNLIYYSSIVRKKN